MCTRKYRWRAGGWRSSAAEAARAAGRVRTRWHAELLGIPFVQCSSILIHSTHNAPTKDLRRRLDMKEFFRYNLIIKAVVRGQPIAGSAGGQGG